MSYFFIINPKAGKQFKNISKRINSIFSTSKVNYEIAFSEYKGHARELSTRAVINGFSNIVVAGGDGTIKEAAEPLVGKEQNLCILPCGSGNGLARILYIPLNMDEAIRGILKWRPRKIDVCLANGQPFFCTAGIGLDAQVARLFNNKKGKRGMIPYYFFAFMIFAKYKPPFLTAYFNGDKKDSKPLIFGVFNGRGYGGGVKMAPNAYVDDGLFNIVIVRKTSFFKSLKAFPDLFNGKFLQNKHIVSNYTSSSLEIKCPPQTVFHLDGEDFISDGSLKFSILPKLLNVKTPKPF
ncbi:MAG: diacylglycerol kinase family lipid kinase [Elusimicrobiales bacterium]|nr:diacylglycerol kinase family lipid kinase [Elusimicrobiales bacterium]MCK5583673.1 diacylglycerol kinase family lipid kinase [Elusimicrobiales bacterium]